MTSRSATIQVVDLITYFLLERSLFALSENVQIQINEPNHEKTSLMGWRPGKTGFLMMWLQCATTSALLLKAKGPLFKYAVACRQTLIVNGFWYYG